MKTNISRIVLDSVKLAALPIVIFGIFALISSLAGQGQFVNPESLLIILRNTMVTVIIAWGMSFNMVSGRWDFSVGAVVVLASILGGRTALGLEMGAEGILLFSALYGALLGLVSAAVYILLNMPPLVVSLGLLLAFEGISAIIFKGVGVSILGMNLTILGRAPLIFIVAAVMMAAYYLLFTKTKFGYNTRSLGFGQVIARTIGVKERPNAIACYAISGLFFGVAGCLKLSINGITRPALDLQTTMTMFQAMMPVLIGIYLARFGNLMSGIMVGSITMQTLSAGLASLGLNSSIQTVASGVFLLGFLTVSSNQERFSEYLRMRRKAAAVKEKSAATVI
jgi:ribose transport system permease protein